MTNISRQPSSIQYHNSFAVGSFLPVEYVYVHHQLFGINIQKLTLRLTGRHELIVTFQAKIVAFFGHKTNMSITNKIFSSSASCFNVVLAIWKFMMLTHVLTTILVETILITAL